MFLSFYLSDRYIKTKGIRVRGFLAKNLNVVFVLFCYDTRDKI